MNENNQEDSLKILSTDISPVLERNLTHLRFYGDVEHKYRLLRRLNLSNLLPHLNKVREAKKSAVPIMLSGLFLAVIEARNTPGQH